MKKLLDKYVSELNQNDNEYYRQDVPNANAADWMWENIPLKCGSARDLLLHFRELQSNLC
jgi:hypothetical protein